VSRTLESNAVSSEVVDTPGKRGRKATPPNPNDGPIAAFAHELWALKRRAGDPSFATMCKLGAAASKSSLAAATRGTALPSWETTWEFVRVLAIGRSGADAEETHREWLARWTAASAAIEPTDTMGPPPADPAPAAPVDLAPTAPVSVDPASASPAGEPVPRPVFQPTRRQSVVTWVMAAVLAALLGSLVTVPPAPVPTDPAGADDATFEGDVTIPDGSVVAPGQTFTKVWQLRNNGSVRWQGRYLSRVNSTPCQAPNRVPIPATDPGRSVRIEVPVTAGESPAHCKIYWKMTDATQRLLFPDKDPIFLDVVVRDPA
jgi:hypothetical protein